VSFSFSTFFYVLETALVSSVLLIHSPALRINASGRYPSFSPDFWDLLKYHNFAQTFSHQYVRLVSHSFSQREFLPDEWASLIVRYRNVVVKSTSMKARHDSVGN
jgi:hypothetical protein